MKLTHVLVAAVFLLAVVAAPVAAREALTVKELNKWGVVKENATFEGNVFARATEKNAGYEIQFYPLKADGTGKVVIRVGYVKEVSGVTRVTFTAAQFTGNYELVDEHTAILDVVPSGWFKTNAATLEYVLIPAYEDKEYPGVIHPTKIVSEYEKNAHRVTQIPGPNEVWYPLLQEEV